MHLLEACTWQKIMRRSPPMERCYDSLKFSDIFLDDSWKHSNVVLRPEHKHMGNSGIRIRNGYGGHAQALGPGSPASEMQLCNPHIFRRAALATSLLSWHQLPQRSYLTHKCDGEVRK